MSPSFELYDADPAPWATLAMACEPAEPDTFPVRIAAAVDRVRENTASLASGLPFGLFEAERLIGTVMLKKDAAFDPDMAVIQYVAIAETRRGTGAGRLLMEQAFQAAAEQGCSRAVLWSSMPGAIAFYRHLGMREFGRLEGRKDRTSPHTRLYFIREISR